MDPLKTIADWIDEARALGAPEPEAMVLATVGPHGDPSVRVVLCRGVDTRGLRFFTNYESRKGHDLSQNPKASVCFFWPVLDRQVRVDGVAERLPSAESDVYFAHRPRGHQLGAWASPQRQPLPGPDALAHLRERAHQLEVEYEGRPVQRPPYWGGFLLRPTSVELWKRGADRLHDRTRFDRSEAGWIPTALAP